jgi:ABC-type Na+ efflux pump permease subunit
MVPHSFPCPSHSHPSTTQFTTLLVKDARDVFDAKLSDPATELPIRMEWCSAIQQMYMGDTPRDLFKEAEIKEAQGKLVKFYTTHITDPDRLQLQLAKAPSSAAKYYGQYDKMWQILEDKYDTKQQRAQQQAQQRAQQQAQQQRAQQRQQAHQAQQRAQEQAQQRAQQQAQQRRAQPKPKPQPVQEEPDEPKPKPTEGLSMVQILLMLVAVLIAYKMLMPGQKAIAAPPPL